MNAITRRLMAAAAALGATGLALVPSSAAHADSWYGRPNTMTCVYTTVMIDGPTNVPATGDVAWVPTVYEWNAATGQWQNMWSATLTNRADRVGITAGPWADAGGSPTYVVSAATPTDVVGPVTVAVYNSFYSWETGQWVDGFWSNSTLTGGQTCDLSGGAIVV